MNQPLYTTDILRLAASLPPFEPLAGASGSAEKRAVTCGSTIQADVRTDADGRVVALAQKVTACAFGQASAAIVQGAVVGQDLTGLQVLRAGLQEWLSGRSDDAGPFAPLAPAREKTGRHGAMLLPLDTVIAAVEDSSRHSREGGSPSPELVASAGGREMDPRLRGDDGHLREDDLRA